MSDFDDDYENEEEETAAEETAADTPQIPQLTFAESRVLGCLMEKEVTTPQQYPLSLNSLHTACNQSSNRNPVTDLGTDEVEEAVESLRYKNLGMTVHQAGSRVSKTKHTIEDEFPYMTRSQQALMCVLMLRGQQTAGELRQRTERMHPFNDIQAVENQLQELIDNKPEPLVKRIPSGGGRRAVTYVHLLCGDVEIADMPHESIVAPTSAPAPQRPAPVANEKVEELEEEIADLRETVSALRAEIDDIKQQLGI